MVATARARSTRAALSAAAQEYILAFRSFPEADGVTPTLVAKQLAVSKQAAAEMFKRLADDKLIAGCTGHARLWKLTAAGEAAADAIFKRHALLEWLLTGVVGLSWAAADAEARRLHAVISPALEHLIETLLERGRDHRMKASRLRIRGGP